MADEQQLVTVTIDGTQIRVPKGTLLVEAAKQIKREIPVYCYHTKMGPAGLCRICLVEIEGMPKLQIACNTPVADGMVVHTESGKASDGRRAVLELYLVNHPLDCPICDKGGECDLQDYAMAYGQGASDVVDAKVAKPKAVDLGPTIVLDEERCVVCQRCVRFDDLIVGDAELVLKDRGHKNIIATATEEPYRHNFTGNVTELCPVGALTSKTYRFKARPWDLKRTATSCTQCAVGCQMSVDTRAGKIQRTMSVETDDAISDTWLCDRGRYNIGFYQDGARLTQPLFKSGGEWMQIGWDDALAMWAQEIQKAGAANAGVIGGGRLTNEEAYLAQHVFRKAGVRDIDWRAGRQRQASPGRNGGKLDEIPSCDTILILGESPAERAPVMDLRVRRAARHNGAKVIRIGSFERPYPAPIPHTDVATVADALKLIDGAKRVAVIWDGVDGALAKELLDGVPAGAATLTYITGEQGNARGAEAMGMHPSFGPGYAKVETGRDTAAMLAAARDGQLGVLSILGANPALHFPDAALVREALEKTPFVVVTELFMTDTAKLANLILPAKGAFEKTGTTTNLAGDVLPLNAATDLATPGSPLTDLEMIVGLAEQLGIELPSAEALEERVIAHLARASEDFTLGDAAFGAAPARAAGGEGLQVAFETRIFAGGGTVANDERIDSLRPLPEVAVSPAVAARIGAEMGDYVDVQSGGVTLHDALVEIRPNLRDDVAVLVDGLPDDPANCFAPGARVTLTNVRKESAELVGASS